MQIRQEDNPEKRSIWLNVFLTEPGEEIKYHYPPRPSDLSKVNVLPSNESELALFVNQINLRLNANHTEFGLLPGRFCHDCETDGVRNEIGSQGIFYVEVLIDKAFYKAFKKSGDFYLKKGAFIEPQQINKLLLGYQGFKHNVVVARNKPDQNTIEENEVWIYKENDNYYCLTRNCPHPILINYQDLFSLPGCYDPVLSKSVGENVSFVKPEETLRYRHFMLNNWYESLSRNGLVSQTLKQRMRKNASLPEVAWPIVNRLIKESYLQPLGAYPLIISFTSQKMQFVSRTEFAELRNMQQQKSYDMPFRFLHPNDNICLDCYMDTLQLNTEDLEILNKIHAELEAIQKEIVGVSSDSALLTNILNWDKRLKILKKNNKQELYYYSVQGLFKKIEKQIGDILSGQFHLLGVDKETFFSLYALREACAIETKNTDKLIRIFYKYCKKENSSEMEKIWQGCKRQLDELEQQQGSDGLFEYLELKKSLSKLKMIVNAKKSFAETIDDLQAFLRERWEETKSANFNYTVNCFTPMTQLCYALAELVAREKKEGKHAFLYLMPTILTTENPITMVDLSELKLSQFILNDTFEYAHPLMTLWDYLSAHDSEDQRFALQNPYPYANNSSDSDSDSEDEFSKMISNTLFLRLINHTREGQECFHLYNQLRELKSSEEQGQLGLALEKLVEGLISGSVAGSGEELNAASPAMIAVAEFSEVLEQLDEEVKKKLFGLHAPGSSRDFGKMWSIITDPKSGLSCVHIIGGEMGRIKDCPKYNSFLYQSALERVRTKFNAALERFKKITETQPQCLNINKPPISGALTQHILNSIFTQTIKEQFETNCYYYLNKVQEVVLGNPWRNLVDICLEYPTTRNLCVIMHRLAVANPSFIPQIAPAFEYLQGRETLKCELGATDVCVRLLPNRRSLYEKHKGVRACIGAASMQILENEDDLLSNPYVHLNKEDGLSISFSSAEYGFKIVEMLLKENFDSIKFNSRTFNNQYGHYAFTLIISNKNEICRYIEEICNLSTKDTFDLFSVSNLRDLYLQEIIDFKKTHAYDYQKIAALEKRLLQYLQKHKPKNSYLGQIWNSFSGAAEDYELKKNIIDDLLKTMHYIALNPTKVSHCTFQDREKACQLFSDETFRKCIHPYQDVLSYLIDFSIESPNVIPQAELMRTQNF